MIEKPIDEQTAPPPPRSSRHRRRRSTRPKELSNVEAPEIAASPSVPSEAVPSEVAPSIDEASEEPSSAPRPSRRRSTRPKEGSVESTQGKNGATEASGDSEKTPTRQVSFAHPSEVEFARILDFYGVRWLYEPRSFPLRWEGTRAVELFTPDFYLPDLDLWLELTTLKQSLVTDKNRKMRLIRELYPEINIKLLYKRDYHRLLAKYGFGPLAQSEVLGIYRVLISTNQVQKRVLDLGRQISQDYAGKEPVLLGVLRGVVCFMADLMREISLPVSMDFMSISTPGAGRNGVHITKAPTVDIKGKDVILVEDIMDTGMTLRTILNYLEKRKPASLEVCSLLDKRIRRIVDIPIRYVGFEVPDEFLVGYGLDYMEKYRNLPFIGVLKPEVPEGG